jgi:predicted ATPase
MLTTSWRRLAVSGGRFVGLYNSLVAEGKIRPDPRQHAVVSLMQSLGDQLELTATRPLLVNRQQSGWFGRLGGATNVSEPINSSAARGLYIFGGCGTGKTMLMDLFFANVNFTPKKRVHFHEYMIDVHARLFRMQKSDAARMSKCDTEWTAASADAQRRSVAAHASGGGQDLVERVADELIAEAGLLCFDEFQVTHISDAVIMRRLFSYMFARGVAVVATSNRPPEDLYLNGLNRDLFLPFIPLLKSHCVVHNMDSAVDYRQLTSASEFEWFRVVFANLQELEAKFFHIASNEIDFDTTSVEVQGRSVAVRRAAKKSKIAWFTFKELCDKPLGSADYIAIAKRFHTVFIEAVPKLTLQERDQVRRFITLIDALYDHGTRIVMSTDAPTVADIFTVDEATKKASVMDEVFAWDRTVSRLTEMTSVEYLIRHIRKLDPAEFFGQFDLDDASLSESDLRQIFVRYDKNNDAVIAVAGLNRMINDLAFVLGDPAPSVTANQSVIKKLSLDGRRIHFDAFKQFVDTNGLLALVRNE